jgi:hypothetical protein
LQNKAKFLLVSKSVDLTEAARRKINQNSRLPHLAYSVASPTARIAKRSQARWDRQKVSISVEPRDEAARRTAPIPGIRVAEPVRLKREQCLQPTESKANAAAGSR